MEDSVRLYCDDPGIVEPIESQTVNHGWCATAWRPRPPGPQAGPGASTPRSSRRRACRRSACHCDRTAQGSAKHSRLRGLASIAARYSRSAAPSVFIFFGDPSLDPMSLLRIQLGNDCRLCPRLILTSTYDARRFEIKLCEIGSGAHAILGSNCTARSNSLRTFLARPAA